MTDFDILDKVPNMVGIEEYERLLKAVKTAREVFERFKPLQEELQESVENLDTDVYEFMIYGPKYTWQPDMINAPVDYDRCLVLLKSGFVCMAHRNNHDEKWTLDNGEDGFEVNETNPVTHWMDLPPLPKGFKSDWQV